MKTTYQKPGVKLYAAVLEAPLATSVSGNTGITIGEGDPPATGSAKDHDGASDYWQD